VKVWREAFFVFFIFHERKRLADILTKPLSRHLFHQITEAILFSHRNTIPPTSVEQEPPKDSFPVEILCNRTNYDSDNGLEAYNSELEQAPGITDPPDDLHESDLGIETVFSQRS
jgi:hypothetical protein